MSSFNMPPGVGVNDIPGNGPDDVYFIDCQRDISIVETTIDHEWARLFTPGLIEAIKTVVGLAKAELKREMDALTDE